MAPQPITDNPLPATRERILLIEDDSDYRVALCAMLREGGEDFLVDTAATLRSGIEMALSESYSCVLLDLALPDSAAPTTCQKFLEITGAPAVIIISGREDPEFVADCIRRGAGGYIVKGRGDQDRQQLVNTIRRAVLQKNSEQTLKQAAQVLHDTAQIRRPVEG